MGAEPIKNKRSDNNNNCNSNNNNNNEKRNKLQAFGAWPCHVARIATAATQKTLITKTFTAEVQLSGDVATNCTTKSNNKINTEPIKVGVGCLVNKSKFVSAPDLTIPLSGNDLNCLIAIESIEGQTTNQTTICLKYVKGIAC
ncbi:hypothetical protein ACLKA6_010249 [Drosophila palustris]